MADFDLGGALSGVVENLAKAGIQYVTQQQAIKQAKKIAKTQAAGGGSFPMLGTGNMGFAAPGYSLTGGGIIQSPSSVQDALNEALNYLGANTGSGETMTGVTSGSSSTACPQLFVAAMPGTMRARALGTVLAVNPQTGRLHAWRHVGSPVLYSGDVAHCRRVTKLLGKASRKLGRGRPR